MSINLTQLIIVLLKEYCCHSSSFFFFNITTCRDLPPSFRSKHGEIVYSLEANLSRSMRVDSKAKAQFTLSRNWNLDSDPSLMVQTLAQKHTHAYTKSMYNIWLWHCCSDDEKHYLRQWFVIFLSDSTERCQREETEALLIGNSEHGCKYWANRLPPR